MAEGCGLRRQTALHRRGLMPPTRFHIGQILWADLPRHLPSGHEQIGRRPVVVVGLPGGIQALPYPVLVAVPLTRTHLQGPLFPVLRAAAGGLPVDSTALVYQVGALDENRIVGQLGTLTTDELAPVRQGLERIFGF